MGLRWIAPAALAALFSTGAGAFQLDLPGEAEWQSASYQCSDGEQREVQYVNLGANSLAILEVEGQRRVFVNVISASGARYVSGPYVWWTTGEGSTFGNEMADEGTEPVTCDEAAS